LEEFHWGSWRVRANGERKRYRESYCKPCKNEYARNRPQIKISKARYQRSYRIKDLAAFNVRKRQSRQANKETHNARSKRWSALNPEKRKLVQRICEQRRRLEKGWNKKSPEIRAAIEQTLEQARVGNKYLDAYTGDLIDIPTIDHIVPISKGGTNDADNLCITSSSNNSSKFNDDLVIWLIKRAQKSNT
jgi:5-methylcytosine-specific restriction endonuclease McrA